VTIASMITAKASVLALEAERTILIDRERMLADADGAGIAVVGVGDATLAEHQQ
jgi:DUF1009 family protein